MGRGNCCTFGKHEGLFYVDNDYLDVFSRYIEEDDAWGVAPERRTGFQ